MKETSKGLKHFFAAAKYSLSGLKMMLGEAAFRQELALGVLNFAALALLPRLAGITFTPGERVTLAALWFVVIITEILNTAIEAVVDLVSPDYHALAKKAKDLGSAAVFCALTAFFTAWAVVAAV